MCEDRVFFVWVDLHVSLCWQQHPYCERAIRLVYPHFFCSLRSSSRPTNINLADLGLEIGTAPSRQPFTIRHVFIWSSLTMTDSITSQNIDFFSWITLCVCVCVCVCVYIYIYISSNLTPYFYCLHHFKRSMRVRDCLFHFVNMLLFLRWGFRSSSPNTRTGGPLLVVSPRLPERHYIVIPL